MSVDLHPIRSDKSTERDSNISPIYVYFLLIAETDKIGYHDNTGIIMPPVFVGFVLGLLITKSAPLFYQ